MDAPRLIRRMHQHRRWTNGRLLEAARTLTDEQRHRTCSIGQGSLWATLMHLYVVEVLWLEVLTGRADAQRGDGSDVRSLDHLERAWTAHDEHWQRYLDSLTPDILDQPIKRINSRGETTRFAVSDVLIHVCTHAQYTAAQGVNILRQLGWDAEPLPDLQLITMSRFEADT